MDLNNSCHSSSYSVDTDVLLKIPNNYFDPNFADKSHFSNDQDFVRELDRFLVKSDRESEIKPQNSTMHDEFDYANFSDPLKMQKVQEVVHEIHEDLNLEEEKLKRQHYEQLSAILQKKIIQYQRKVTELSKSCHEKEHLLQRLKHNEGLDVENKRLSQKVINLEKEITETISLINRFQSKNDALEMKIENLTLTSSEMREIAKKQISDLETRLMNSHKIGEEQAKELKELREKCKEIESMRKRITQLEDEKLTILENHEKDRKNLELKQKKIFTNMMDDFTEKERNLLKELDMQRAALKNYYQSQLETALEEKVSEFQQQVEQYQAQISRESDNRERIMTDKAIRQIEMIVKKNEEEIDLTNRKHSEEIELYKIQLLNATRTIESLELKLNDDKLRRTSIAENLHSIMETQWKKTLEVLKNPSTRYQIDDIPIRDEISESDNNHHEMKLNNLSKSEENLKAELLRNYIEKLLKQSPKHEQVDESNSQHLTSTRSQQSNRKPWK